MVTSISGNNVTWRDSKTGNLITDVHQDLEKVMAYNRPINNSSGNETDRRRSKNRRKGRKKTRGRGTSLAKQSGGYISGPSHEQGGIPAYTPGEDPIELEGGEYIINAQTVDALGVPFLDELNSTQTSYHQGGFEQGQLPSPSNYRRGGKIKKMAHGGSHNGSGYGSSSSGNMAQTNLIAQEGEFINRRTGQPVMMGTPYHIHPEKGPMEGAVHNPNISGGTQGHDFFDKTTNGRNNMRRGGRPSRRKRGGAARRPMKRGGSARPAARKMRRGGRPRRMAHGGLHSRNNGCGAGMMMSNGGCVPMSGGYRRGGRTRSNRRMMHGGMHNALGAPMNPNMGAGYVFEATNQQYNGPMVRMGQVMYSAPDGVYSSNSKPLVHMSDNVGPTRRLGS